MRPRSAVPRFQSLSFWEDSRKGLLQAINVDGLCQMFFETGLKTSLDIFRHSVTDESHGWNLAYRSGGFDEVNTRPIWQTNVTEEEIKLLVSQLLTGCRDRCACFHFVSHLLQNFLQDRAVSS